MPNVTRNGFVPWRKLYGSLNPGLVGALVVMVFLGLAAAQESGLTKEFLDKVSKQYGGSARERLIEWRELIRKNKNNPELSEKDKLELVNDFFNDEIEFLDDIDHWGKEDYWATPVETLVTQGGDCEDFSIAKYFTLKEMGVPVKKMLITYVKALELDQAHMVLTYYENPASDPLVLDNLIDEIKPGSTRDDLAPVYTFNSDGLWMAKERGRGKKLRGGPQRMIRWRELDSRMKKEGIK
ncbi:T1SS associated transglutaminase-like cysteine proteinase LapP [hydrothermal vent metagenome]|uniref:T1SS associated transglutaminase-like cysteine proteinase LapP n=1 Tax=hydrothermal vent metagenome TaxID=652676 RepID=A0A3B1CED9_9ZZZZ